ncbi:hypothetical protein RTG_01924 [Rhodotorula toruloides ATCC 204091]|uniref:Uncharacterized protein conserved in bacteria (DUF2237)-domain containing protein n=1 Tax=Rhodotorula toruloides TaxID=5286 RepID=A0A2T0ADU2_RHOTO|nr:hypothetical protein RTG_01924 [Rhodotorula toruloides ATCC 204091]PRQ76163.1 Uncharacterized protein conserved in bacteria (DUF2237)-domain containing protein [Rhodotorula toruloides]
MSGGRDGSSSANGGEEGGLPVFPRKNSEYARFFDEDDVCELLAGRIERRRAVEGRAPVFGDTLRPAPVGDGPTTGFFRNNFCDASPHDPGSHTVAAVVTPTFLDFSRSRGNDLWPLFPRLRQSAPLSVSTSQSTTSPPCVWCLCASRWYEALKAAASHPLGEQIVPRVVLEATHERAPLDGGFSKEELERFAVGGDGTGGAGGGGNGPAGVTGWEIAGGATGEKIGR